MTSLDTWRSQWWVGGGDLEYVVQRDDVPVCRAPIWSQLSIVNTVYHVARLLIIIEINKN